MRKLIGKFCMLMVMAMFLAFGLPTVLTADVQIPRKEAGLQSYPVEDSVVIYKGAKVCLNAAGYLIPAADTIGYIFAGIAYEKVDNTLSGHAQGGKNCRVYTGGIFLLTATSITQAMVGRPMFVVDDASIDDISTNSIFVGMLVEYVSATSGWVSIMGGRLAKSVIALTPHILMSTIADGDLVTGIVPGFAGKVLKTFWVQDVPVTTAAKLSNLNIEIGTTNLTGGVVALTSAECTPKGKYIAGSAITGANVFGPTDTISVEAATTTAFVEGSGTLYAVLESFD